MLFACRNWHHRILCWIILHSKNFKIWNLIHYYALISQNGLTAILLHLTSAICCTPAKMSIVHGLHAADMTSAINSTINTSMMSDAMSEPSSPESATFDESDLLNSSVHDDVTAQLASAGQPFTQFCVLQRIKKRNWYAISCLVLT